jgi:hypothetical protein
MENPLLKLRGQSDTIDKGGAPLDSAVAQAGADHTYLYATLCGAFGLAASIWLSSNIQALAYTLESRYAIWAVVSAVVLTVIVIFQSILVNSRMWNLILIGVETLGLLSLFVAILSGWILLAAVLFFLWIGRSYVVHRSSLEESTRIRFMRYASAIDTSFYTGLTIFCSLLIVALYQQAGTISQGAYTILFRGVQTPLTYIMGVPVAADRPVEAVVRDYATKQIESNELLKSLTASERVYAINTQVEEGLQNVGEQLGAPLLPNETMGGYTYRLLNKGIEHIKALKLGPFVVVGLLLFAALFVRSFLLLVKIPVLLVAQGFYWFLNLAGVISITAEPRPKEIILIR